MKLDWLKLTNLIFFEDFLVFQLVHRVKKVAINLLATIIERPFIFKTDPTVDTGVNLRMSGMYECSSCKFEWVITVWMFTFYFRTDFCHITSIWVSLWRIGQRHCLVFKGFWVWIPVEALDFWTDCPSIKRFHSQSWFISYSFKNSSGEDSRKRFAYDNKRLSMGTNNIYITLVTY